jgi:hypothetical protein
MLPDDVFRHRLEETLVALEAWAGDTRDCAAIDISASPRYWHMSVAPQADGTCPFELMLQSDQTFTLKLVDEVYEDRPIERFDLFLGLVEAIAAGAVDRIETFNAQTEIPLGVEMRVELAPGWDWIGAHRVTPRPVRALEAEEERRTHRFLPYRRQPPATAAG